MTVSACIRVRVLGRPVVTRAEDSTPIRLSTRKVTALVAYLAMNPDQTASREELATLLWGSCSDYQARQSLRQALAFLRKDLGSSELFTAHSDVVRLKPGVWSVDALAFENLSKSSNAADLDKAAELFCGDFLSGLNIEEDGFAEWLGAQRTRTQLAAARLCETFAAQPALVIDRERAVAAAERLLALDPLREDWQRLALTLYARYRGKGEALAQYDAFSRLLRRELDVEPEAETKALAARIRDDAIAPVAVPRPVPPAIAVAAPDPRDQPGATPAPRWPRWSKLAAAAALVALIGGGVLIFLEERAAPDRAAPTSSATIEAWRPPGEARDAHAQSIVPLAVLPFAALGETAGSTQLLADMVTDDLINVLSRVPVFRVISRQTTSRYKNQPVDLAAIGAQLQVRYVLEGSVRIQDGALRVNAQLLDPATRSPVWSGRVEREQGERYAIRDEIVARIARELQIDILPIEGERRSADHTADASAFLGWAAMYAAFASTDLESYRKAEAHFKEALARDPQHVSALIGLGSFHSNVAVQHLVPDSDAHHAKARELLEQALEREPRNPTALYRYGILLQATGKIRDGLKLFEKVIALDPSNAGAHAHYGHALARLGEPEKGIEYIRYAMRLSPQDGAHAIWHEFIGTAELELNRYGDAIASFGKSAAVAPRYPRPLAGLAAAYALAGDAANAKIAVEKLRRVATSIPADDLLRRLGRNPKSRAYAGLSLALASASDTWRSPPLPSRHGDASDTSPRAVTAVAVTPFQTFGDVTAATADAITDDLTNILSRVPQLRVISRQTMRSYAEKDYDAAKLGAELGVHYVLEGSVRPHGDTLRVNVALIDPANRQSVWTARIERQSGEPHDIQDEIVARIARELHFEVLKADSDRASTRPDVFELTRAGWKAIFEHATQGVPALARAEAAFTEVLKREPDHWGGRAGLGAYHTLMGSLRLVEGWPEHLDRGEQLLTAAIAERPHEPGVHFYLSIVQRMRGRFADAVKSLERCIEIAPSAANCHAHIGHALVQQGRAADGMPHINYALRLSPQDMTRSQWQRFAGEAEMELGHLERAIDLLRGSYDANRRQPLTLRSLAAAYALAGNTAEAHKVLGELKTAAPHFALDRRPKYLPPLETTQPELSRGLRIAMGPPT